MPLRFGAGFFVASRREFLSGDFGRGFLLDGHLHRHDDVAVQLDGHVEVADLLQRLVELDLAAIDVEPLCSSSRAMSAEVTEPKS